MIVIGLLHLSPGITQKGIFEKYSALDSALLTLAVLPAPLTEGMGGMGWMGGERSFFLSFLLFSVVLSFWLGRKCPRGSVLWFLSFVLSGLFRHLFITYQHTSSKKQISI